MVRFKNTAGSKEAKAIMTMPDPAERPLPPVIRRALEFRFRLTERKFDLFPRGSDLEDERALTAVVRKGVSK
jgi:hypothetical protein